MGKTFDHITEEIHDFITQQHVFFVASAPLAGDGHVNVSPKGMDTLRILSPQRVAYLDVTGSGNETSAHIAENGRLTLMFCAFNGAANIVRLYGTGHTILKGGVDWEQWLTHFTPLAGMRQIIVADIHRVSTSCGYGVPLFDFKADRDTLVKYWGQRDDEKLQAYHQSKNMTSIDGLPTPLGKHMETE